MDEQSEVGNGKETFSDICKVALGVFGSVMIICCAVMISAISESKKLVEESLVHNLRIVDSLQYPQEVKNSPWQIRQAEVALKTNYQSFLEKFYEHQNNWLSIWLTALAVVFALLAIGMPLCFIKMYEMKREEMDKIITQAQGYLKDMTKEAGKANSDKKQAEANRHFVTAKNFLPAGKYQEAIDEFEKAIKIDPEVPQFWVEKAQAFRLLKQYKEALAVLNTCIQKFPLDGYAYYVKGLILSELEDFPSAETAFKKALERNPAQTVVYIDLCAVYLGLKNYESAFDAAKSFAHSTIDPFLYEDSFNEFMEKLKQGPQSNQAIKGLKKMFKDIRKVPRLIKSVDA